MSLPFKDEVGNVMIFMSEDFHIPLPSFSSPDLIQYHLFIYSYFELPFYPLCLPMLLHFVRNNKGKEIQITIFN